VEIERRGRTMKVFDCEMNECLHVPNIINRTTYSKQNKNLFVVYPSYQSNKMAVIPFWKRYDLSIPKQKNTQNHDTCTGLDWTWTGCD